LPLGGRVRSVGTWWTWRLTHFTRRNAARRVAVSAAARAADGRARVPALARGGDRPRQRAMAPPLRQLALLALVAALLPVSRLHDSQGYLPRLARVRCYVRVLCACFISVVSCVVNEFWALTLSAESMGSKQQMSNKKVIDYKWEYLIKSRCTERWLKFASFRRVSRGVRGHSPLLERSRLFGHPLTHL
jgi:hypothetical protein